jgi:FG-GAP repeat
LGQQFFTQNTLGSPAETGDQFGTALAAGDFNGNGRDDLAIGVPLEDVLVDRGGGVFENVVNAGEVGVLYGSSSGLSTASHAPQFWHQAVPGIPGDPETSDHFGAALTAWNFGRNEGSSGQTKTADLAIPVPYEDVAGVSSAGAVNVIYGSAAASGLTSTGSRFFSQDTTNVPGGPEAGDHFGAAVY